MISNKMTEELNDQLNKELYSAYLYMAMSSYSSFIGLKGAANWFLVQCKEEMMHVEKFYNYINSQASHVVLKTIEQPPSEFETLLDMVEKTFEHEKTVTAYIHNLVNLASSEKDHATEIFLQWFVSEQVEEEESASDLVAKIKLVGNDGSGLFMIDNEMGTRVFVQPTDLAQ